MTDIALLAIESSGSRCSIALQYQGKISSRIAEGKRAHTENLLGFIEELINENGLAITDLSAIAFSAGPGSFTGIRLAASVAKSLAYAAKLPVIAISSLALHAQSYFKNGELDNCVVITDAKMGELYYGQYSFKNGLAEVEGADALIAIDSISDAIANAKVLVGDAASIMSEKSDVEYKTTELSATDMLPLAQDLFLKNQYSDALDAQAVYLRDKSGWKNLEQQNK